MSQIAIANIPMGCLQHLGRLKPVTTGGARFAGSIVIINNEVSAAGKAVAGFTTGFSRFCITVVNGYNPYSSKWGSVANSTTLLPQPNRALLSYTTG